MNNNFFTEVLSSISDIVDVKDMTLLFSDTSNNVQKQARALQMICSQRVKGLIITPATEFDSPEENQQFIKELNKLKMPIVIVDRDIPDSKWDSILFENFQAGYLATKAMLDRGRKRIGIITGDMKLSIARERYNGYVAALNEARFPLDKDIVMEGDFSIIRAAELTELLLEKGTRIDGIVSSNNFTSIGLMSVLNKNHMIPGGKLGIVGIDKVKSFEELGFYFTHVSRDTKLIGKLAVEKLIERFNNPEKDKEVCLIPAQLILEGSE
jgi:LacI family transcriptional regulator